MTKTRFTSRDLEVLPDPLDDTRYEIIDGELYVAHQPTYEHQTIGGGLHVALDIWSRQTDAGVVTWAPGVIFAEDDNVAPDLTWVAKARLPLLLGPEGHFHAAPDLIVEVLSPGRANEQRDRELKLGLYSRRGVREYWIVDWQMRQVEVYRRRDAALALAATLLESDTLTSPLLPGFALPLSELFARLP
jgi:Uma2 family endonuclease